MKIASIILSAGASTRMTGFKQLLEYKGDTLLKRLFDVLKSLNLAEIVCVTGELHDELMDLSTNENISFIQNKNYKNGMLSTVQVGLSKILEVKHIDAVLICLSDQPLIPISHYEELINQAKISEQSIICSSYNETFGPPVIFKKQYFEELLDLEGKSAKPFISKNMTDTLFVNCEKAGIDIDTDEDYKKLILSNGE